MVWLINLKIATINTTRMNHLRSVPRDSITGWEIKNNMYVQYPVVSDPGLGCSRIPWMWTIQVHPSWSLLVDWICSALAGGLYVPWVEGGRSLLQMIPDEPGWAEIHSTPVSFAWHIEHNCTLGGSVMTRCTPDFLLSCTHRAHPKVFSIVFCTYSVWHC